jgi:hypothetical protein
MEEKKQIQYDPREFIRGFQQVLTSNTKKIAFLAGAGTSMSIKDLVKSTPLIPGVEDMTNMIELSLASPFKEAFKAIKSEILSDDEKPQIENILSRVRLKAQVAGSDVLCGLNKTQLNDFEKLICRKIKEIVSPNIGSIPDNSNFPHQIFARWINHASRHVPIEIFTTNYDYLFEIAFEREKIAYFDGFTGSHQPFFNAALVEENNLPPNWIRLWKVHGSLGWRLDQQTKRIIRDRGEDNEIMVYPSLLKYDDSRKQPYVSFIDRLSLFLREDDSVLIVCGYSFGDQHLNDTIMNALTRSRTSQVFVLNFLNILESDEIVRLGNRDPSLTIFAPNAAVIGGTYGKWALQREPSKADTLQVDTYFDEDAFPPPDDLTKSAVWKGTGKLKLGNFMDFVSFLSIMNSGKIRRDE